MKKIFTLKVVILILLLLSLSCPWASADRRSGDMEFDTDRPGMDFRNFDLQRANPELCMAACTEERNCKAWTYVKPGVQGPSARCWLKNSVPPATRSDCCVSGVKNRQVSRTDMEFDTDRPGMDFRNFDLQRANPELCMAACADERNCRAWTYVKPGVQGPSARCWLKNSVPRATRSDCCVSGVKNRQVSRTDMEFDTDRPGMDFRNFDLQRANPELCMAACAEERNCRAWTYVKPGVQGPSARCWLKNSVPRATRSDCCVSGVK